jgi:hypothetical protein
MSPSNVDESAHKEGQLILAKIAFERGQFKSIRAAAEAFGVVDTTLGRRRKGILSRRVWRPKSMNLTELEEDVIVKNILNLDSRGFPPKLCYVRDMANSLRDARGLKPVGQLWPGNFVRRTPEIKTRYKRRYDYQRAKCEDPTIIGKWFDRVQAIIAEKGIDTNDIFNFDETGFQMGVISGGMVVTGSERRNRPKAIQPGNRQWVTVIQGISAKGRRIPPFIIFPGKNHMSNWYEEDVPAGWVYAVSDSGWTTNELGFSWLKHFDKCTKDRIVGVYRLLILDGHESHDSVEFRDYCEANHIIPFCMPAHASHLLQPLDIGCFGPLKKAYGNQIEDMMRNHINHITKLEFIPAFKVAFESAITESNILGSFRGSGLVPFDPNAVLSQLEVRLRTPTPPIVSSQPWEAHTPCNPTEMASQTNLIKRRITCHQDSSPTLTNEAVDQFLKGAQTIAHQFILMQGECSDLRKANATLSRRKARKRRRIQNGGSLTRADGLEIITQIEVDQQIGGETRQKQRRADGSVVSQRRCGRCRQPGHRIETCPLRVLDTLNSGS